MSDRARAWGATSAGFHNLLQSWWDLNPRPSPAGAALPTELHDRSLLTLLPVASRNAQAGDPRAPHRTLHSAFAHPGTPDNAPMPRPESTIFDGYLP